MENWKAFVFDGVQVNFSFNQLLVDHHLQDVEELNRKVTIQPAAYLCRLLVITG
jgi:hypothetical protein